MPSRVDFADLSQSVTPRSKSYTQSVVPYDPDSQLGNLARPSLSLSVTGML